MGGVMVGARKGTRIVTLKDGPDAPVPVGVGTATDCRRDVKAWGIDRVGRTCTRCEYTVNEVDTDYLTMIKAVPIIDTPDSYRIYPIVKEVKNNGKWVINSHDTINTH